MESSFLQTLRQLFRPRSAQRTVDNENVNVNVDKESKSGGKKGGKMTVSTGIQSSATLMENSQSNNQGHIGAGTAVKHDWLDNGGAGLKSLAKSEGALNLAGKSKQVSSATVSNTPVKSAHSLPLISASSNNANTSSSAGPGSHPILTGSSSQNLSNPAIDDPKVLHNHFLNLFFHQKELELAFEEDFFMSNSRRLFLTVSVINLINIFFWVAESTFLDFDGPLSTSIIAKHIIHASIMVVSLYTWLVLYSRADYLSEKIDNPTRRMASAVVKTTGKTLKKFKKLIFAGTIKDNVDIKKDKTEIVGEALKQPKVSLSTDATRPSISSFRLSPPLEPPYDQFYASAGSRRTSVYDTSVQSNQSVKSKLGMPNGYIDTNNQE